MLFDEVDAKDDIDTEIGDEAEGVGVSGVVDGE